MREVIFDSSFLMAVAESPTTWFEDITDSLGKFKPAVLDCVLEELGQLAGDERARSRLARVALELATGFQVVASAGGSVDDRIASAALQRRSAVATTDATLAETLGRLHVLVVGLRSGRVSVR